MQTPFFSVVIPTLDEQKTLPKLLQDLESQTFQDFDVWIVDGGSKDKTVEITQSLIQGNKKYQCISTQTKNVSMQRNVGAEKSTGTWVVFFDADIRIPSYYLEGIHYNLMKKKCDAWTTWCSPDLKTPEAKLVIQMQNIAFEGGEMLGIPYAVGAALGVRREVFQAVGGFDASLSFMEDTELARRIHKNHYRFSVFRDPMFIYSTRRFRKEGTFSLIAKLAPVFTTSMMTNNVGNISSIYPMTGGTYYTKRKKEFPSSLLRIREVERIMKKVLRSKRKEIQKTMKDLFNSFSSS